jgi:hypothetical protein
LDTDEVTVDPGGATWTSGPVDEKPGSVSPLAVEDTATTLEYFAG